LSTAAVERKTDVVKTDFARTHRRAPYPFAKETLVKEMPAFGFDEQDATPFPRGQNNLRHSS
jgi:hypothetical protein